jgi:energy-coupling factor transport system substrate-specific component
MQTKRETSEKNYFRFWLALVLCLLARLIPFRAPNVEPILATTMPIGRAYGTFLGFSFAFSSILLYDLLTHTFGMQTFFTASAYGLIGLASVYYFQKKNNSVWNYVRFSIYGTLFFDAVTGLTIGPIFFHQSFMSTLVGQIPFTALHLLGNIVFALILSPAIYKFLIRKKKKKILYNLETLNPKII